MAPEERSKNSTFLATTGNASRRELNAWTRIEMIVDAQEREQFKAEHRGLRAPAADSASIDLTKRNTEEEQRRLQRRSERSYDVAQLSLESLSGLLNTLRAVRIDGKLKYGYGSAGSSYPVQTYLYVKPGRVTGLDGGTWFYHPLEHALFSLRADARVEPALYYFENRSIFESAAFAVFFVGRMDAIAPLYGEKSRDFALIEAGLMTQLLELAATSTGIGLCQIGDLQFAPLREAFALAAHDILLHSLVGGRLRT